MTYPAAKPATLPKVLISAMPTAAAAPVRNFAGTVQKLGSAAKIAHAVTVITATVAAGEPMNSASGTLTRADECRDRDVPGAHAALGGVA